MGESMASALSRERARILAEYRRRESDVAPQRYAPWSPAERLFRDGRRRLAARLLREAGRLPDASSRCLEVGFGHRGWLPDLVGWGAREENLFGVEIDPGRSAGAGRLMPAAHLVLADGGRLPWPDRSFHLVVASMVLTSVLDSRVRRRIAQEIERVLVPGGALLWYDFTVDNPANRHVRGVRRRELRALFPGLDGRVSRATLAPPLARLAAPVSRRLAELLESLPFLRTHLLAVLIKPSENASEERP